SAARPHAPRAGGRHVADGRAPRLRSLRAPAAVVRGHYAPRRVRLADAAARRRPRPGAARLVPDQRAADSRRSLARDARQSCRRAAARAGHGGIFVSLTAIDGHRARATRIAVTSGKGGVGKTSLTINLAVAMARLGHRVGILDADFALGNIDVMLGLTPEA